MKLVRALLVVLTVFVADYAAAAEADAGTSLSSGLATVAKGLAISVGALFIGLGIYRRYNPSAAQFKPRRIKIKERTAISGRASLVLVEVDGKEILLATGVDTTRLLKVLSEDQCFEESLATV